MDDDERLRPEPGPLATADTALCHSEPPQEAGPGPGEATGGQLRPLSPLLASVSRFTLTNCGTVYLN